MIEYMSMDKKRLSLRIGDKLHKKLKDKSKKTGTTISNLITKWILDAKHNELDFKDFPENKCKLYQFYLDKEVYEYFLGLVKKAKVCQSFFLRTLLQKNLLSNKNPKFLPANCNQKQGYGSLFGMVVKEMCANEKCITQDPVLNKKLAGLVYKEVFQSKEFMAFANYESLKRVFPNNFLLFQEIGKNTKVKEIIDNFPQSTVTADKILKETFSRYEYRSLDLMNQFIDMDVLIYNNKVAIVDFRKDLKLKVIDNPYYFESIKNMFNYTWEKISGDQDMRLR